MTPQTLKFALALFVFSQPGWALELEGALTQGGMVVGGINPSASAEFRGRPVRVSSKGIFVIGFGRDAPARSLLMLRGKNGRTAYKTLKIKQRGYDIQRIDGLPPGKVDPAQKHLARIRKESALVKRARRRDSPRNDFMHGFVWPVAGRISGVYGSQRILNGKPRRPHYGVDIAAPTGTPVIAPADGEVSLVHSDMFFSGKTLIIDHGHGISSSFLHLHKILVKSGQAVKKGDVVAQVGATGRVTGAHLDWRMNWFEIRLDPALAAPPR